MSNVTLNAIQQTIHTDTEQLTVTSQDVAKLFEKQHKNVLQDIQELNCSPEFRELNFQPSQKPTTFGIVIRPGKQYTISKDGFMLLCMGYRGDKAMQVKELYITAFNLLEQRHNDQHLQIKQLKTRLTFMSEDWLKTQPKLQKIASYRLMGLQVREIAKLMDYHHSTVSQKLRKLENYGIVQPSRHLAQQQQHLSYNKTLGQ